MISHRRLAQLCSDSYDRHSLVVDEVEVLVELVNGVQVVAIRGTEASGLFDKGGWRDVLMDLRIGPSGYYGLRGHAGFFSGARAIERSLVARLDKYKPVIVTGHSLGGGIAIPVARMLAARQFNVVELVTFGCPRCITRGHDQFKTIAVSQYEYGNDIVPTFQFWTPRKHFNRCSVGQSRNRYWWFHRTWGDHGVHLYIRALT